jgi:hypothetical protein
MRRLLLRSLALVTTLLLAGCGVSQDVVSSPTPGPTATPIIIVVVVTATPLPATRTPAAPANQAEGPTPNVPSPSPLTVSARLATPLAQSTFRLCAAPDPATERAIEQYIGGRSFRATLSTGPNGCDQLAIVPEPGTASGSGRQSVSLSTDGIKVQIVTENGITHVSTSAA